MPPSGRHALVLALATLAVAAAPGVAFASGLPGNDPVIAAAGDISCAQAADGTSICRDQATSDLIVNQGISRVLGLGDQQYESGELANFNAYYDPTWGRIKDVTSPALGNHEYQTGGAAGYFAYFGARAPASYYSYDVGQWHLISLDGTSDKVDATQVSWLRTDLAANAGKCTLAYWHHPRFSSGSTHGNTPRVASFWTELYNAKADIVLNGHEHHYERFAPQDPNAAADPALGIREFVVGTGGKGGNYPFGTLQPNSEVRSPSNNTFGVLELALRPGSYEWLFVPAAGGTFTDSGTGICHSAADLEITKSDAPDPVLPGQTLTYTLTARNGGPSPAHGVTVTDSLPSGPVFQSASASQGGCAQDAGTVTCSLGTIASGATATVTVETTPLTAGSLVNSAAVQASEPDPDPSDNQATEPTTVGAAADLSLTKTDEPDPVLVNELLSYTLTATNDGPSAAAGVTITDTLPAGTSFESASVSQGICTLDVDTVRCLVGPLDSGGVATATITVRPATEGAISNTAAVESSIADPDGTDNQAIEETIVDPVADLSLSMSDSPDPVAVGEALTYALNVLNSGPSSAGGVTVSDTLPKNVRLRSARSDHGRCVLRRPRKVECTLGGLGGGESADVTIVGRPTRTGTSTNTAAAGADQADPNGSNNQLSMQTSVFAP